MRLFILTITTLLYAFTALDMKADDTFTVDGIKYQLLSGQEVAIKGYEPDSFNCDELFDCPDTVSWNGSKFVVTAIADGAFKKCGMLRKVKLPKSISQIGESAFEQCEELTEITILGELSEIKYCTFYFCKSLSKVKLPSSITSLGFCAFCWCNSLENIELPDSLIVIDEMCFEHSGLKKVTLPNKVKYIKSSAFSSNDNLQEVVLPEGLVEIADGAFGADSTLQSITIPSTVSQIGLAAFHLCSKLRSINIPDNIDTLHLETFAYCTELENINISKNSKLTFIANFVFNNCVSLKSITIPPRVEKISQDAFYGCKSLNNIDILVGTKKAEQMPIRIAAPDEPFEDYLEPKYIDHVTLNRNFLWEGEWTYLDMVGITWNSSCPWSLFRKTKVLTIGKKVTEINTYMRGNVSYLDSIYVKAQEPPAVMRCDIPGVAHYSPLLFLDEDFNHVILNVPLGSLAAYQAHPVWGKFLHINEVEFPDDGEPLAGDVNDDGKVNASDVTALINQILGIEPMDSDLGDVNGDGRVNVSDVAALINIILGIE